MITCVLEVQGRCCCCGIDNGVAEGVGFEPTEGCPSHAFQACRFGRSRIPPGKGRSYLYPSRGGSPAASVGSGATGSREPSQVRKEAALSGYSRVPPGRLIRAGEPPVRDVGSRCLSACRVRPRCGPATVASWRCGNVDLVASQSLYRKYRPQRFGELVGQQHVITALRNAIREGPRRPRVPLLRPARHREDVDRARCSPRRSTASISAPTANRAASARTASRSPRARSSTSPSSTRRRTTASTTSATSCRASTSASPDRRSARCTSSTRSTCSARPRPTRC